MAVHVFQPIRYHTTLGPHEPVLTIADGDAVETTTVDAAGYDAAGVQVAPGGNPQTGPFYIAGAEPGDTLVVRLERIRPSRSYGWAGTAGRMVAPNIVDPAYTPELPWPAPGERRAAEWHVDAEAGTARLVRPQTALGALTLPIRPMLGCFGVAPSGRPGDLDRHLGRARRQHGLPRLRRGRDGLLPGLRAGRAVLPWRRPRPAGRRRDRGYGD